MGAWPGKEGQVRVIPQRDRAKERNMIRISVEVARNEC
jgi:hypothetical protein